MRLSPPTNVVFRISMLLAIFAFAVRYVPQVNTYVPIDSFWVAMTAFVLLALGCMLKGF